MKKIKAPLIEINEIFPFNSRVKINNPDSVTHGDTGRVVGYDCDLVLVKLDSNRPEYQIYEDSRTGECLYALEELIKL